MSYSSESRPDSASCQSDNQGRNRQCSHGNSDITTTTITMTTAIINTCTTIAVFTADVTTTIASLQKKSQ